MFNFHISREAFVHIKQTASDRSNGNIQFTGTSSSMSFLAALVSLVCHTLFSQCYFPVAIEDWQRSLLCYLLCSFLRLIQPDVHQQSRKSDSASLVWHPFFGTCHSGLAAITYTHRHRSWGSALFGLHVGKMTRCWFMQGLIVLSIFSRN